MSTPKNDPNPRVKHAPDHGSSFVPGAGDESQAPKSLDHFKRGYQERADMREREFYSQKARRQQRGGTGDFKDPWANRDRVTIVYGLDCNRLLDEMESANDRRVCFDKLDQARKQYPEGFECGKAITALISASARRRNTKLAYTIWEWIQAVRIPKNVFHYNAMISVAATERMPEKALELMEEMTREKIPKNEVTFSSAITACEKKGDWRTAIGLLDSMEQEGFPRTAIAYNAAISACEKGMVPAKACEVFNRMKREGITPSVVTYSALISAAEKGGQWKLALEILEDMKNDGHRGNVIAYSAAISALAKGQQWELALQLFREIQSCGREPSIVTYNATMTALEKGLQWEKALGLFDEMKMRNLPITVVSYGSAISACDKGLQYRQCLEFLDEMTEMGIQKNVIIFGAALSCMEKCCRADICFQLMERMRQEGVAPNVHIYNSAISACARSNLWEKGYELFREMDTVNVARDVVTYNAVLDAVCSQIRLGRMLLEEGVKKGFYARVSRLAKHWFELDLHFMSLGGGEIALGWWFEECLVPYLTDTEKLQQIKSISIVTGYGKTRTRGRRHGDDGMRKRVKAMLMFMNIKELEQPNLGRIHIDMEALLTEIQKNGGRIIFNLDKYLGWKEAETTINQVPDVEQKIRPRYRPKHSGSNGPPFERIETDYTSPEYRLENMNAALDNAPVGYGADNVGDQPDGLRGGPQQGEFNYPQSGGGNWRNRDDSYGPQGGGGLKDDRAIENRRGSDRGGRGSYGGYRGGADRDDAPPRERESFNRSGPDHYGSEGHGSGDQGGRGYYQGRGRGGFRGGRGGRGGNIYDRDDRQGSYGPSSGRDDRQGSYGRDDRGPSYGGRGNFNNRGPPAVSEEQYGGGSTREDRRNGHGGSYDNNRGPNPSHNRGFDANNDGGFNDQQYGPGRGSQQDEGHYGRGFVQQDDPRGQQGGGDGYEGNNRKRGFNDYERNQPQTRGYDLEPDRQRRRHD